MWGSQSYHKLLAFARDFLRANPAFSRSRLNFGKPSLVLPTVSMEPTRAKFQLLRPGVSAMRCLSVTISNARV